MKMRADLYGTRFAVDLRAFKGEHDEYSSDDKWFGDVVYAVQLGLQEFVHGCDASTDALHSLENGLRALCKALTPTSNTAASRWQALQNVQDALERIGDVVPFGSWVAGLHTPSGDLDLSFEGCLSWKWQGDSGSGWADELNKKHTKSVLKYATALLRGRRIADGWVDQILNARVPLLKFTEASSGLACDLTVGGSSSLFKSVLLGQLAAADWRVGALVRLVKAWARQQGINSAGDGTLSSHALTLMVVWHLQMRSPAVLPPINQLFAGAERPLQDGKEPRMSQLQGSGQRLRNMQATDNCETLVELLASFFSTWHALLGACLESSRNRWVAASTWNGGYIINHSKSFSSSIFSLEEPTDFSDNVARSVRSKAKAALVVDAFALAEELMQEAMGFPGGVRPALRMLFGNSLCRSSGGLGRLNAAFVQPVRIVPMEVPASLHKYVNSRILPIPATVDHEQPRSWDSSENESATSEPVYYSSDSDYYY